MLHYFIYLFHCYIAWVPPSAFPQSCLILFVINSLGFPLICYTVLHYTAQYYTIKYCDILYYKVLHCTLLHYIVLQYIVLHCKVLHCKLCTALYGITVDYNVIFSHCTVLACTVLHCTVLHCTELHCIIRLHFILLHCHAVYQVGTCSDVRGRHNIYYNSIFCDVFWDVFSDVVESTIRNNSSIFYITILYLPTLLCIIFTVWCMDRRCH